jgi:hypothetical protein
MAKQKRPVITTPRGTAIYPHLNTPDTKFKDKGEYHVRLSIPAKNAEALIDQIDKAHAASQVKAKEENPKEKRIKEGPLPYETHPEDDNQVIFRFKMNASFVKNDEVVTMRPRIFDAKGNLLEKPPRIGGGSELKVSFEFFDYYTKIAGAGVTLRLKAVQLLKLVEYSGGGSAESFGFEEEEGFEADNTEEGTSEDEEKSEGGEKEEASTDGSDF